MSLFTEEGNYNCVITNDASKLRPRPVKKLLIRLISGHHLPKSADQKIKGNVIQPYVSLKLRGHVLDEAEFTTEVIPKVRNPENPKGGHLCVALYFQNGFNPIWESCTEFYLVYPQFTFLEFQVRSSLQQNSKSADDPLIGQSILPYTLLRKGYRHVFLEDEAGHRLTPACLFLHLAVIDCAQKK